ncbi:MAG: hypothetical protein U9Q03_02945 [Patescibacteria group bacterium]|nr:hypothetical protein [Patescibacteria group bacterium]
MGFEQFGWNILTYTFVGTVAVNLIGFWGIWHQARTVYKKKSGKSVSVIMHAYTAAFMTAAAVYGIRVYGFHFPENALLVGMLRVPLFMAVLVLVRSYKGFSITEKMLMILFVGIVMAEALVDWYDWLFLAGCFGTWVCFAPQIWEIWKNGRGACDVKFLWVTVIAVLTWTLYSFALGDWVLKLTNPIFLVIVTSALVLWYVRGERNEEETTEK